MWLNKKKIFRSIYICNQLRDLKNPKTRLKHGGFLYVIARIPVEYPQQPMVERLWESVPQVYSERQSALMYGQNVHIDHGRMSHTYFR